MRNKGQSEMAGFAIILIIVTVLIMVFLSFSASNDNEEDSKSYKITSFLTSFAEVTTECEGRRAEDYLSMQKVISRCNTKSFCYNDTDSCEIMEETIDEIMKTSWKVGEDYPIKGYTLKLLYEKSEPLLVKEDGIKTKNKEGSTLMFPSDNLLIELIIYN